MARSSIDGSLDGIPTACVVGLEVTYSAALPDPKFRRLVNADGVGLDINPRGEPTFLWAKRTAVSKAEGEDALQPALPPDSLGDIRLLTLPPGDDTDPSTLVPSGYSVNSKSLTLRGPSGFRQFVATAPLEVARRELCGASLEPITRVGVCVPISDIGDEDSASDDEDGASALQQMLPIVGSNEATSEWLLDGYSPSAVASCWSLTTPLLGSGGLRLHFVRSAVVISRETATGDGSSPAAATASTVDGVPENPLSVMPASAGGRWDVPDGAVEESLVRVLTVAGWAVHEDARGALVVKDDAASVSSESLGTVLRRVEQLVLYRALDRAKRLEEAERLPFCGPFFGGLTHSAAVAVHSRSLVAAVCTSRETCLKEAALHVAGMSDEALEESWRRFMGEELLGFVRACLRCKPDRESSAPKIGALLAATSVCLARVFGGKGLGLWEDDPPTGLLTLLGLVFGAEKSSRTFYQRFGKDAHAIGIAPSKASEGRPTTIDTMSESLALMLRWYRRPHAGSFASVASGGYVPPEVKEPDALPMVPPEGHPDDVAFSPNVTYVSNIASRPSRYQIGNMNAFAREGGFDALQQLLERPFRERLPRDPTRSEFQEASVLLSRASKRSGYASVAAKQVIAFDPISQRPGEAAGTTGSGMMRADRGWKYPSETAVLSASAVLMMLRALQPLRAAPRIALRCFGDRVAPALLGAVFARLARPTVEDMKLLSLGDRDSLLVALDEAMNLAKDCTDDRVFGSEPSQALHSAIRVREATIVAIAVTALRRAFDAVHGRDPMEDASLDVVALGCAGLSLLRDVANSCNKGPSLDGMPPLHGDSSSAPIGSSMMTTNPMHAASAASASAAAATGDSLHDLSESDQLWPEERLPCRWTKPKWLAWHLEAEGVPSLLLPDTALDTSMKLLASSKWLTMGVTLLGLFSNESIGIDALSERLFREVLATGTTPGLWRDALCNAIVPLMRFSRQELIWSFWEQVEGYDIEQATVAFVRMLALSTVAAAEAIRVKDRRPPFPSRFLASAASSDAKPKAGWSTAGSGVHPQEQHHFGAHLLFEIASCARCAPEVVDKAQEILPRVLDTLVCKPWLSLYVESALRRVIDSASTGQASGGAILLARRLLKRLPASSLGMSASQESVLTNVSKSLGGDLALQLLLLKELVLFRKNAAQALGVAVDAADAELASTDEAEEGDAAVAKELEDLTKWSVDRSKVRSDMTDVAVSDSVSLSDGLAQRLEFLKFCLMSGRQHLGRVGLMSLWKAIVVNSLGRSDVEAFLSFVRAGMPLRERQWASSSASESTVRAFVSEIAAHTFLTKCLSKELSIATSRVDSMAFALLDTVRFLNLKQKKLALDSSGSHVNHFWIRCLPQELYGVQTLWDVVLQKDLSPDAAQAASDLLRAFYSRVEVSPASKVDSGKAVSPYTVWVSFADNCLVRVARGGGAAPLLLFHQFLLALRERGPVVLPGATAETKPAKAVPKAKLPGGANVSSADLQWPQPVGSKAKTLVDHKCTVRIEGDPEWAGRCITHKVRVERTCTVGELRALVAQHSGRCGSNRLRLLMPTSPGKTQPVPRDFDSIALSDVGLLTSSEARVLVDVADDTRGAGGFEFVAEEPSAPVVADAALATEEPVKGAEEPAEEEDTPSGEDEFDRAGPWPMDPLSKAALAPGRAVQSALGWMAPLQGSGPCGAAWSPLDERRGLVCALRAEQSYLGALLSCLRSPDTAELAWRVLRLAPWHPAFHRSVVKCEPAVPRVDKTFLSRVEASLRGESRSASTTVVTTGAGGGGGRTKRRQRGLTGAVAWRDALSLEGSPFGALPALLSIERCISNECHRLLGLPRLTSEEAVPLVQQPKVKPKTPDASSATAAADVMVLASASAAAAPLEEEEWIRRFARTGGVEVLVELALSGELRAGRGVEHFAVVSVVSRILALLMWIQRTHREPLLSDEQVVEIGTVSCEHLVSLASSDLTPLESFPWHASELGSSDEAAVSPWSRVQDAFEAGTGSVGASAIQWLAEVVVRSIAAAPKRADAILDPLLGGEHMASSVESRVRVVQVCEELVLQAESATIRYASASALLRVCSLVFLEDSALRPMAALVGSLVETLPCLSSFPKHSHAFFSLCQRAVKHAANARQIDGVSLASVLVRRLRKHRVLEPSSTEADALARGLMGILYRVLALVPEECPDERLQRELAKLAPWLWNTALFALGGDESSAGLPTMRTMASREFAMKLLLVAARVVPNIKSLLLAKACALYGCNEVWGSPPPEPEPWGSFAVPPLILEAQRTLHVARESFAQSWPLAESDTARYAHLARLMRTVERCRSLVEPRKAWEATKPPKVSDASFEWDCVPDAKRIGDDVGGASKRPVAAGIANLGATCYLNATLQQLFSVRSFRQGLLALDIGEDEATARKAREGSNYRCSAESGADDGNPESLLWQLQVMFAHLQEQRLGKPADATGLCLAFRDWEGQPIHPTRQQDASEFLASLFQQIEARVAGTRHARLMEVPFGIQLLHSLNADAKAADEAGACERCSCRREQEMTLSVPVVGHTDLLGGLHELIEPARVDYKWPVSGAEGGVSLPTNKRQLVGSCPPHLLLHLSRFRFDAESLTQKKVNDRMSFPVLLDVFAFTPRGHRVRTSLLSTTSAEPRLGEVLERVEALGSDMRHGRVLGRSASRTDEDPDVRDAATDERLDDGGLLPNAAECVYMLSGVIVHRGTAQAGHYWSLVRDRREPVSLSTTPPERVREAVSAGSVGASALGLSDQSLGHASDGLWWKLDDRKVSEFSLSELDTEAFGGKSETGDGSHGQSAFLLVYDQVDPAYVRQWATDTLHSFEASLKGPPLKEGGHALPPCVVGMSDTADIEAPRAEREAMLARWGLPPSIHDATVDDRVALPRRLYESLRSAKLRAQYVAQALSPSVMAFMMDLATLGDPPEPEQTKPRKKPFPSPRSDWTPHAADAVAVCQLGLRILVDSLPKCTDSLRLLASQWAFVLERLCRQSPEASSWLANRLSAPHAWNALCSVMLDCPHEDSRACVVRVLNAAALGCHPETIPSFDADWRSFPQDPITLSGSRSHELCELDALTERAPEHFLSLLRETLVPLTALCALSAPASRAAGLLQGLLGVSSMSSFARLALWSAGCVTMIAAAVAGPTMPLGNEESEAELGSLEDGGIMDDTSAWSAGLGLLARLLPSRDDEPGSTPPRDSMQMTACLLPRVMSSLVATAAKPEASKTVRRVIALLCTPSSWEGGAEPYPHAPAVQAAVHAIRTICRYGEGSTLKGALRVAACVIGAMRNARYSALEAKALESAEDMELARQSFAYRAMEELPSTLTRQFVPTPLPEEQVRSWLQDGEEWAEEAEREAQWRVELVMGTLLDALEGTRQFRLATEVLMQGMVRLALRSGRVTAILLEQQPQEEGAAASAAGESGSRCDWWPAWLECTAMPKRMPPGFAVYKAQAGTLEAASAGAARKTKPSKTVSRQPSKSDKTVEKRMEILGRLSTPDEVTFPPRWLPAWVRIGSDVSVDRAELASFPERLQKCRGSSLRCMDLVSPLWRAGDALVTSDDDAPGMAGLCVAIGRGKSLDEGEITRYDESREEFSVSFASGKSGWFRLAYQPFRIIPPRG
jgi:hypothetical protein